MVGYNRQWLKDFVFHHVLTKESTYCLKKILESLYERKTATNKAFLIHKLVNVNYKEGASVAEHLNEVKNIVNQLTSMKVSLDDKLQTLLLLSSLPDSWETLVVSLSNSASDRKVSISTMTNSLFNEGVRHQSLGTS